MHSEKYNLVFMIAIVFIMHCKSLGCQPNPRNKINALFQHAGRGNKCQVK